MATLEADSYQIVEATRGTEALIVAQKEHPDLFLLDVNMPDLNGLEVCRRLKADPNFKDTPVVMLTSASEDADRAAGMAAGADTYLTKPFSPLELLEAIQQQLSLGSATES
jgi:DNA-binding response OmpR family regulator